METWAGEQYREVIGIDGKWNGKTRLVDTYMEYPNHFKRPKRIFVGSMTDLFLHSQSNQGRDDVERLFGVMAYHKQHTFQILTKRPAAMKIFSDHMETNGQLKWPLSNVWLGVTVCNQDEANSKIPILLDTPAICRFISIEPMLGKIDLTYLPSEGNWIMNALTGISTSPQGTIEDHKLDWVICGGETGPGARIMMADWADKLLQDCRKRKIPFFFKSAGSNTHSKREIAGLSMIQKLKDISYNIYDLKQFPE
jgi:protein gp37